MPLYDYRCRICGFDDQIYDEIANPSGLKETYDLGVTCPVCLDGPLARVFSFSVPADPVGDGYYDNSIGAYVTSERQLHDLNKIRSEEVTARTGIPHDFQARRIEDMPKPEVD